MTDDELKSLFEALRQESAAETRQTAEVSRRHFEVFTERLEKRFDLLAESVQAIDEKVDRTASTLELAIRNVRK
jgi:hypothetical protein